MSQPVTPGTCGLQTCSHIQSCKHRSCQA